MEFLCRPAPEKSLPRNPLATGGMEVQAPSACTEEGTIIFVVALP